MSQLRRKPAGVSGMLVFRFDFYLDGILRAFVTDIRMASRSMPRFCRIGRESVGRLYPEMFFSHTELIPVQNWCRVC